MTTTIQVKYSCAACGLKDVICDLRAREPEEDVVFWFQTVIGPSLAADHTRRSPHCHPKALTEVKVRMTGTDYIGGPVKH